MLIIAYGTVFGIEKRTRNIMSKILIFIALALLAVISSVTALHPPFVPHTTYMCNHQPYNIFSHICCNAQLTPINGFRHPSCCGNVGFDIDANVCCAGALKPRTVTSNGCCGATAIDTSVSDCCNGATIVRQTQVCCRAKAIPRTTIYDVCCGAVTMDVTKSLCCEGVVKKITDTFPGGNNNVPYTFACCGSSIFETNSHYCYYGHVYPRSSWVPWWQMWHH
ncbi:galaxin-2-like isoform X1 [Octopus sinensis]|uniref:Galaxin-2-like isoform X1 n=1 Tax=Octopus sinensis TaxID=2607531 RepID=A0A7E6F2U1_9MOLL|nr:galaxin-2-like isoform X1 [Octopus sinensis]